MVIQSFQDTLNSVGFGGSAPVNDRSKVLRVKLSQHTFDTIISAIDVVIFPYEKGAKSGIIAQQHIKAYHSVDRVSLW